MSNDPLRHRQYQQEADDLACTVWYLIAGIFIAGMIIGALLTLLIQRYI